jgi:hypothetical protein
VVALGCLIDDLGDGDTADKCIWMLLWSIYFAALGRLTTRWLVSRTVLPTLWWTVALFNYWYRTVLDYSWYLIQEHTIRFQQCRGSPVGLATCWTARVRFLGGASDHSLRHSVHTSSGAHTASYPVDTGGSSPGGKVVCTWSWPVTSTQCRGQEWFRYTPTTSDVFMAWCVIN